MKAYLIEVAGFAERSITAAESASKAKYRALLSLDDAGYDARFQDIRARRAPNYDPIAGELSKGCRTMEYADLMLAKKETKQ